MRQLSESEQIEIVDLFRGIYEADEKIEAIKESQKQYANSKKEMIKNAAEKLDVRPLHIKRAYKDWLLSVQDKEETEIVDGIVAFLQEFVSNKIK